MEYACPELSWQLCGHGYDYMVMGAQACTDAICLDVMAWELKHAWMALCQFLVKKLSQTLAPRKFLKQYEKRKTLTPNLPVSYQTEGL